MQTLWPGAPIPVSGPRPNACPRHNPRSRRPHTQRAVLSIDTGSPRRESQDEQVTVSKHLLKELRQEVAGLREKAEAEARARKKSPAYLFHQRRLTRQDYEVLPHRIVLLRHGESQGNVNVNTYQITPDHAVSLTLRGQQEATIMGQKLRSLLESRDGPDFKVFLMTSPYCRTLQTTDCLLRSFTDEQVVGVRQAVQLREQDFGNFQDSDMAMNMRERQRFGRFYYRFPNGESGADVYDRLTIFEDHLTRDMLMGRFAGCSLTLVTHGLTLRIFLMRWFHWTVDEFLEVYNPDNCAPIVLEKLAWEDVQELQYKKYAHAKHLYAITPETLPSVRGCTADMSSYFSRTRVMAVPRQRWLEQRRIMAERGLYGMPVGFGDDLREASLAPDNYASYTFEEQDECMQEPCATHVANSGDFTN